jgi:uncharacterized membrane protein YqhA
MFKNLLRLRFFFLIGVFFNLLNSIVFTLSGVAECIKGYKVIYQFGFGESEGRPAVHILQGLDLFLVGLVFMIFALGIMKIFTHYNGDEAGVPNWLKIKSFKELKVLLWETILVTLVVFTLTGIVSHKGALGWETLILPLIILILTMGLFLMREKESHKDPK